MRRRVAREHLFDISKGVVELRGHMSYLLKGVFVRTIYLTMCHKNSL